MANYSNIERETNINFNNEDKSALIYTCQAPMRRRLEKLAADYPDDAKIIKTYDDNDGIIIEIPKTWIKVRPPNKTTEEQRRNLSERLGRSLNRV